MRNFTCFLVVICCMCLMTISCRTTSMVGMQPEMEQQWIGRSYVDVVDSLGKPEREVSDLQDGKILVYEAGATRLYMNSDSFCYAVRTSKQRKEAKLDMPKSWALGGAIVGGVLTASSLIQTFFMIFETAGRK